jgi:glycosyltransferase involved in cell wall biosynthesis
VSVVVPVRDRRELLAGLLSALDHQTFRSFEVIVVDDGSTDGSDDVAREAVVGDRAVRLLVSGGNGAVRARTEGVSAAFGEILAFTDSDCVPDREWLQRLVDAIDAGADVVNGRTVPARSPRPGERSMGSENEGLYPTCNVAYRRSAYDRAGGFDARAGERFGFRRSLHAAGLGFGEDTVLAWRVRRGGVATYEPRAVVAHHVFPRDWRDAMRRAWMAGAFPALIVEVPELRSTPVAARGLLGGGERLPFYAALAATALRRRGLVAAAAAWWGISTWRRVASGSNGVATTIDAVVMTMAVDAVTATALLAGSARARTLLL